MKTFTVLGTPLAVTDYAGAVAQALEWAADGTSVHTVAAPNTHGVTMARRFPEFGRALRSCDMILPDGMPLVWVMNQGLSEPMRDRVYGPTYMLRCLEAAQGEPWRHLMIGGTDDLLADLRRNLLARFPGLQMAESYAPPFGQWTVEDDNRMLEHIRKSGAQFVWIGLGAPKQESWLAKHKAVLPPGVYSAVGAAFPFHAGRVKQAPSWMQDHGLEWIFRLCAEPRRLWKRYFVYNSLFIFFAVRQVLEMRRTKAST